MRFSEEKFTFLECLIGAFALDPGAQHRDAERQHGQGYRRQILNFVDSLRPQPKPKPDGDRRGMIDVAFASMQTMQDTITRLKLAGCPPDVLVQVPRNACGFFEFWRAEELIALGRERTAQAMAAALQGRHMAARAQGR